MNHDKRGQMIMSEQKTSIIGKMLEKILIKRIEKITDRISCEAERKKENGIAVSVNGWRTKGRDEGIGYYDRLDIKNYIDAVGYDDRIRKLEEFAVKNGDYRLYQEIPQYYREFSKSVAKYASARCINDFAIVFPDADMDALSEGMANVGDAYDIEMFARLRGANAHKLCQGIVKTEDPSCASSIFEFMKYVKDLNNTDYEMLIDKIIKLGNKKEIWDMIDYLNWARERNKCKELLKIDLLHVSQFIIRNGEDRQILLYQNLVDDIHISQLSAVVGRYSRTREISDFVRKRKNANICAIRKEILKQDIERIINYANAHIEPNNSVLEDEIIKMNDNGELIYKYALRVRDADIEKLSKAMADTKNLQYIWNFWLEVENADKEVLANAYNSISKDNKIENNMLYTFDMGKRVGCSAYNSTLKNATTDCKTTKTKQTPPNSIEKLDELKKQAKELLDITI